MLGDEASRGDEHAARTTRMVPEALLQRGVVSVLFRWSDPVHVRGRESISSRRGGKPE